MYSHYWYINHGFKFQILVCHGWSDLSMSHNINNVAIITVKGVDKKN